MGYKSLFRISLSVPGCLCCLNGHMKISHIMNSEVKGTPILCSDPCRWQMVAGSPLVPSTQPDDLQRHFRMCLCRCAGLAGSLHRSCFSFRRKWTPCGFRPTHVSMRLYLRISAFKQRHNLSILGSVYKRSLFWSLNLCERGCANETWHFCLLNLPSPGKGAKRVHKTPPGIWGSEAL